MEGSTIEADTEGWVPNTERLRIVGSRFNVYKLVKGVIA